MHFAILQIATSFSGCSFVDDQQDPRSCSPLSCLMLTWPGSSLLHNRQRERKKSSKSGDVFIILCRCNDTGSFPPRLTSGLTLRSFPKPNLIFHTNFIYNTLHTSCILKPLIPSSFLKVLFVSNL